MDRWKAQLRVGLRHPYTTRIINSLAFYGGWSALVVNAAKGKPNQGLFILFALMVLHFILSHHRKKDVYFILSVVIAGTAIDTAYLYIGALEYMSPNQLIHGLPPLWRTGVDAVFAMSVDYSLFWLRFNLLLASVFGACGAVLSYRLGVALGACKFLWPGLQTYYLIAAVWVVFMPLCTLYSEWLNSLLKIGRKPHAEH